MDTKRLLLTLIVIITVALAACAPAATPAPPSPTSIVQHYYDAVNKKQLDTAMTFIADEAVFVNPYGRFVGKDDVRESLQLVMSDGITFELSNFRETDGRVVYDYKVFVNGEQVEVGTDGLTIVRDGKITRRSASPTTARASTTFCWSSSARARRPTI